MKKIHSYLLAIAALLVFAPALSAQTIEEAIGVEEGKLEFPNEGDFSEESNIGFKKDISKPIDGKYWLKLEAFATGSATQTTSSKPSDVILVLDLSSSMDTGYPNSSSTTSRLDALKSAVTSFLGTMKSNAQEMEEKDPDYDGNRIAIITYSGDTRTTGSNQHPASQIYNVTEGWLDCEDDYDDLVDIVADLDLYDENGDENSGTRPELGLKKAIDDLLSGNPDSKREGASLSVLLFTDGYPVQDQEWAGSGNGNTRFVYRIANDAVYYASILKQQYKARIFTVAMIDRISSGQTGYENFLRVEYLLDMISSNYPNAGWGDDYVLNSTTAWNVNNGTVSVSGLVPGDPNSDPEAPDYSQFVSDSDLTTIFETFATQSGGSPAETFTEESEAVDVVSSSFLLPENTQPSDIKVFTAPYLFNSDTGELYFGTETLAPNSEGKFDDYEIVDGEKVLVEKDADVDANIDISISEDNKTVSVTGFDYADNWCGPVKQGDVTVGAKGHKVIIMIPIVTNPDAVGGPNVDTNGPGSGIKDKDGNMLVHFDPPAVSLPVNIHIKTTGLEVGESAKYSIKRKAGSGDWQYVTSVFVTRHKGDADDDPIVYIKGLPSIGADGAYSYMIVEDDWDWTYTLDSVTGIGKDGDVEITAEALETTDITTDLFTVNPIVFNNSKTEGLEPKIHYSESKATNTFGTGVGYDDYKNNDNRKVIGDK